MIVITSKNTLAGPADSVEPGATVEAVVPAAGTDGATVQVTIRTVSPVYFWPEGERRRNATYELVDSPAEEKKAAPRSRGK